MVRRLVVVMYAGTVATVFGLSMYHAAAHDYSYTGSSRFAWTIAYLALLILASYSAGLPDVRAGRSRFATAAIAAGAAAIPISAIQLALGSAILPRFVVFGSAVALTVWWWLIARWSSRVATAAGESDLVVFVGGDSA
ncbi:MAG: hypothetical protein SGJ13_03810, partial [Actinomycetota bacterium]|nr:hypothetical protein [Actinomycetota bacterium]